MKKVLVVDDNTETAQVLAAFISQAGYAVETAADGGQGLAKMATFLPDVVVLDLMMPKVNGWELLDSKASYSPIAAIPVVVLSGYAQIPQPLPEGQIFRVLDKPAELEDILAAITAASGNPIAPGDVPAG